jgi:D-alanyl-D-alanine carboxypeptidase
MKKKRMISLLAALLSLSIGIQVFSKPAPPRKYRKIQKFLDEGTRTKLAGVVVYIKSPKYGEWIGTSGYSDVQNKQPVDKDDIFCMASIAKMYNAVVVLKLAEERKLRLDDKISNHLPDEIIENIPHAKDVTIRHLLGHTSGIAEFEKNTELASQYLAGQIKLDTLSHINVLRRYVYGKPSEFTPGTRFQYNSTNYTLLAMIVDNLVPEGHADYLRKLIAESGFINTYYKQTPPQRNVKYYGDLNRDEVSEDLTAQTFETTNWFIGSDGAYAPIEEAAHFLQALMAGKILNEPSLNKMKTGNRNIKRDTGLGLATDKSFPYGLLYGHSGRAIGVTNDLYYFPKKDITVGIFCNSGLREAAPGFKKAYLRMRTKIVKKLFLF